MCLRRVGSPIIYQWQTQGLGGDRCKLCGDHVLRNPKWAEMRHEALWSAKAYPNRRPGSHNEPRTSVEEVVPLRSLFAPAAVLQRSHNYKSFQVTKSCKRIRIICTNRSHTSNFHLAAPLSTMRGPLLCKKRTVFAEGL